MRITGFESNEELLAEIGVRIKRSRLAASLTQADLARKAGLSTKTVVNLEAGKGATLENFINVLRALNMAGNIETLVPDQGVRPSDLARLKKERQRAGRKSKQSDAAANARADYALWTWGEDK